MYNNMEQRGLIHDNVGNNVGRCRGEYVGAWRMSTCVGDVCACVVMSVLVVGAVCVSGVVSMLAGFGSGVLGGWRCPQ